MDIERLLADGPHDLGLSPAVTVDQAMVDQHADTTGDDQWIHRDLERTRRESPMGGPIAQGFLLLALLTRLTEGFHLGRLAPGATFVNYGLDRVRFVQPVMVGSDVRLKATLATADRRDDGSVRVGIECHLLLPDDQVAVVAQWIFLVIPPAP